MGLTIAPSPYFVHHSRVRSRQLVMDGDGSGDVEPILTWRETLLLTLEDVGNVSCFSLVLSEETVPSSTQHVTERIKKNLVGRVAELWHRRQVATAPQKQFLEVPIIQMKNVGITYGTKKAVAGLTLTVRSGEVVGLLGGNGAGKSSTMRAIGGVNPHTSGELTVSGCDLGDPNTVEMARRMVGYCPDVGGLMRQATVREHIALALAFRGMTDAWPYALALVEKFNLLHVLDTVTHGFSHGMSRRLSVLLAVLTSQTALVLDEPFDGVDPLGVDATIAAIRQAADAGLGVLISTHLLDLVVDACDTVAVLVDGRVVSVEPAVAFSGPVGKQRYTDLLRNSVSASSSSMAGQ